MNRIRQFICCYLALCLAGGGAVAVNPLLHRLLEHGGAGVAHTHLGGFAHAADQGGSHHHDDGDWHAHEHLHEAASQAPRKLFDHPPREHAAQQVCMSCVWRGLLEFLSDATVPEPHPSNDVPDHQHQSVFQLLAGGLVDQPLDGPTLSSIPTVVVFREAPPRVVFVAREWDALTASRGPPAFQS